MNTTAHNELEQTLQALARHKKNARLVWLDYLNEKYLLEAGLLSPEAFENYTVKLQGRLNALINEPEITFGSRQEQPSVFLSYNHADMVTALAIQEEMARHQVTVRMDSEITIGLSIKEFVIRQIRENTAVIWLVSEDSFKSAWVNYEITLSAYSELLTDKHLIPVCKDLFFMDDQFYDRSWNELDAQIRELDQTIGRYQREGKDPQFLDSKRAGLLQVKNQLSPLLKHLRQENRVYSVAVANFSHTIKRIADLLIQIQQEKKETLKS